MVCMAGLQVFIVRFFFQGARKGEPLVFLHRMTEKRKRSHGQANVRFAQVMFDWSHNGFKIMDAFLKYHDSLTFLDSACYNSTSLYRIPSSSVPNIP